MSTTISLLFGLLVAIVILATLATRLRIPYAILLVLGGLLLGFVPGLPTITINPELFLVLFLPPLIYSSAWLTSWREFRANLRPILQLSLGLVLVTTIAIAVVAHTIAGLSWPVAFVLGAVVSPRKPRERQEPHPDRKRHRARPTVHSTAAPALAGAVLRPGRDRARLPLARRRRRRSERRPAHDRALTIPQIRRQLRRRADGRWSQRRCCGAARNC